MVVLAVLFQVLLGVFIANAFEWFFHKYVLHGLGKKKDSIWSFHWSEHHKVVRKNYMLDGDYLRPWKEQLLSKEVLSLGLAALLFSPIVLVLPVTAITVWLYIFLYFYMHRKAHVDVKWAMKWLPHHIDHHMSRKTQDANWCVVFPLMDYIMGTRIK